MPPGWDLSSFFRPGGGGFELFFARRVGNLPIKKLPVGFARGGWSGLEFTNTLILCGARSNYSYPRN